jgi:hypothetical protein
MIRTAKFLFCDNEHGAGNVTFPDILGTPEELEQHFIRSPTLAMLRKEAKQAGWSRHNGADYCQMCTENGI